MEKTKPSLQELVKPTPTQKAKEALANVAFWGGLAVESVGLWIMLGLLPATATAATAIGLFVGGSITSGVGKITNTVLKENRKRKAAIAYLQSMK